MKRDESCLVANSPSEPKFIESIRCQKMVEIHGYNKHVTVTGEDDNPCHATLSDNTNSVRNYLDVSLFMVGVKVWVLEHFSILYRLCGYWCLLPTIRLRTMRRLSGCAVSITYPFMSCSSLTLFAADSQKVAWHGLSSSPVTLKCLLYPCISTIFWQRMDSLRTLAQRGSWWQDMIHPSSCNSCESWKTNVFSPPCNTCIHLLWQYQQIWHESCWH